MIEYVSDIVITVTHVSHPDAIQVAMNAFGAEFTSDAGQLSISFSIKTAGSPESKFSEIATIIWWANKNFCELQFFVSKSSLSYSSPTIYQQYDYDFIVRN